MELSKNLLNEFKDNVRVLSKNDVASKKLMEAQRIILGDPCNSEIYSRKPYLTSNQNQQYVSKILSPSYQNACLVASAGDTLFETVRNNVSDITIVDTNDLQQLVVNLRIASIFTLNNSEFETFLLDSNSKFFLSHDTFISRVKEKVPDLLTTNFWDVFLGLNPVDDILNYFFKGGLERTDIYNIRQMLPYIKKRGQYMDLRSKLSNAEISFEVCDIIDYLLKNPEKKFDYIDLSNILLFMFQGECDSDLDKFSQWLEKLRIIFENNLNDGGTFAIDYMFGIDQRGLINPDASLVGDKKLVKDLYVRTYSELSKLFDIQTMVLPRAAKSLSLDGLTDVVVYTKK